MPVGLDASRDPFQLTFAALLLQTFRRVSSSPTTGSSAAAVARDACRLAAPVSQRFR